MRREMERTRIGEFLIGMSLGAGIGMLFAPRAGDKTRARISDAATQGAGFVKDHSVTLSDAVIGLKHEIERHKHGIAEAIKSGTYAYKHAVN
jgi:gas vesicle protein